MFLVEVLYGGELYVECVVVVLAGQFVSHTL